MKPQRTLPSYHAPFALIVAVGLTAMLACQADKPAPSAGKPTPPTFNVTVNPAGPLMIKSQSAEFEVLSSGYVRAYLLKGEKRLSMSSDVAGAGSRLVMIDGKEISDFTLDLATAKVSDSAGGSKVISISGASASRPELKMGAVIDAESDSPNMLMTSVSFTNSGPAPLEMKRVEVNRRRLDARLVDTRSAPFAMWGFFGTSYDWGKDNVIRIARNFSQPNVMGAISKSGAGGGVPVVALWSASVGEAIGHLEPTEQVLSIPVRVEGDQRVSASIAVDTQEKLVPGKSYSTPRTFLAVYEGDFYEPLSMYARGLAKQGWKIPAPTNGDYEANWCGWGYRSDVTLAQMLGTIPKLKELGFKWATLDYRWFNNFGDWEPRPETFTRETIKKLVDEYHREGIKVQLWWLPLAVSDGQAWEPIGPEERSAAARAQQKIPAKVLQEHPDWLILGRDGKPARLFLNRAALCPALPEVQEYYRKLTEKFIHEWDFDGHKLDMCFTMPACYNPKHHHQSPEDSIRAMADVFKVIFETTRRLKPDSVTQVCPCGTSPNFAWLPYMDQAVTADPVGAVQVRHRIKMYKALMGPQAAVYGDHVELSAMRRVGQDYLESGSDFASTVGLGGVLGTKFTWPDYGPPFKNVFLTPEKEAHWKKWIDLYNAKMLSRGVFRNFYTIGYDVPEGYAIEKDGKMYYAFFAPEPDKPWKGEVELRGLQPGKYRVLEYENGNDLGTLDSSSPRLATEFRHHLMLEVSRM
ncbi:MAG: glycoside hydrolase family 36 protein [Terriglobia bacterium]